VSRAYYAAFYAAEAALLELGETRSKHSGVVAAFIQYAVRDEGLDPKAGRYLRSLFDRRAQADYGTTPVPVDEAHRAVGDALSVVDTVAAWLDERSHHDPSP
jgi:uncharacterized protein (UPF0332 family)